MLVNSKSLRTFDRQTPLDIHVKDKKNEGRVDSGSDDPWIQENRAAQKHSIDDAEMVLDLERIDFIKFKVPVQASSSESILHDS